MNKLPIKIAIVFCAIFILVFGGCILFSLNLYNEALATLDDINEQYADKEVIQTSSQWSNSTPLAYSDGIEAGQYTGYNAIYKFNSTYFVSYSEHWNQGKLQDLAVELYNNTHGEEINYVACVELVDGETESYAGYQTSNYEDFQLPIAMYGAMPLSMTMPITSRFSIIRLTGADINTTVETMARTLSHEYGHHYTQFYFGFTGTDNDLKTDYFDIRNELAYDIYATAPWDYYLANHMWHVQELAAEDYVYLMGSPTAHRMLDYKDAEEIVEVYSKNTAEYELLEKQMVQKAHNSTPHENPVLRTPNQVPGLAEYYYSFLGETPPVFTEVVANDLNIDVKPDGASGYEVTWSQFYTDPNVLYTLVVYNENDEIVLPLKTTTGAEPGKANIGKYVTVNGHLEYTFNDGVPQMGFARFRVVTVLPDMTASYSKPYDVQFT